MSAKEYDNSGISLWFANKKGSHNYLDKTSRPSLGIKIQRPNGELEYWSLFDNSRHNADIKLTVKSGRVTLSFPANIGSPIGSNSGVGKVVRPK